MFLEDLITILDTKFDVINICIEIFLMLSYIANQNLYFKSLLEKSESFMKVMQKIISLYSVNYFFYLKKIYIYIQEDDVVSKLISQCIAQLPIEDFQA